jgi:hypothetical protein
MVCLEVSFSIILFFKTLQQQYKINIWRLEITSIIKKQVKKKPGNQPWVAKYLAINNWLELNHFLSKGKVQG